MSAGLDKQMCGTCDLWKETEFLRDLPDHGECQLLLESATGVVPLVRERTIGRRYELVENPDNYEVGMVTCRDFMCRAWKVSEDALEETQ